MPLLFTVQTYWYLKNGKQHILKLWVLIEFLLESRDIILQMSIHIEQSGI